MNGAPSLLKSPLAPMGPETQGRLQGKLYGPNAGTFLPYPQGQYQGPLSPPASPAPGPQGPVLPPMAADLMAGGKPISGPTGGSIASSLMDRQGRPLTNEEAQTVFRMSPTDSKYMPSTTVGGDFGKPLRNVDDLIRQDQSAARQGSTREAMLYDISHPGSRLSGPLAPKNEAVGKSPDQVRQQFLSSGKYDLSNGALTPVQAYKNSLAPPNALQGKREAYLARRAQDLKDRRSGSVQTPAMRRQALRDVAQQTAFERAFAMQNPGAAAQMAAVKQGGLNVEATNKSREKVAEAGLKASENNKLADRQANERAATLRAGFDPDTKRPLGASPLAPTTSALANKVSPEAQDAARKLAGTDPEAAKNALVGSGATEEEATQAIREMTGNQSYGRPSAFTQILKGLAGEIVGGVGGWATRGSDLLFGPPPKSSYYAPGAKQELEAARKKATPKART